MATTTKKQLAPSKPSKKIMKGKAADPVTRFEYIRRKNALEKKINPEAPDLNWQNLMRAINKGAIPIYVYGGNVFIDWVVSKDYVFRAWSIHKPTTNKKAKKK